MKNLEQYLRKNLDKDVIDHIIRASFKDDKIVFYIHPAYGNGDTLDFAISGNALTPIE